MGILILAAGAALIIQAFISLSFFVSSVYEKEKRATFFGGLQFLCMLGLLVIFLYLARTNYFETGIGLTLLIAGLVLGILACLALLIRTGADPKALEGAKGLVVGEAKRPDEAAPCQCHAFPAAALFTPNISRDRVTRSHAPAVMPASSNVAISL